MDFLTIENDCNILIDAKGIEISRAGLLSHRAEIVFGSIKNSARKAIKQGNETMRRIKTAQSTCSINLGKGECYLFVVTFDALYLGSNTELEPLFGARMMDSLHSEFGRPLPIPLTNVFFGAIDEFEYLLSAVQAGMTTFVAAIKRAQKKTQIIGLGRFHSYNTLWNCVRWQNGYLPYKRYLTTFATVRHRVCGRITKA